MAKQKAAKKTRKTAAQEALEVTWVLKGHLKNAQHAPKKVYTFVPVQDFSEPWTDEKLYKKYGLTKDEIAFIESMVRPMPACADDADREANDE